MRTRGFELTEVSLTTRQRRMEIRRSAKVMNVVNGTKRDNSVVMKNQRPEMMLFLVSARAGSDCSSNG